MPLFVSGSIHQGHEMFGNESLGRQCAFIALNAILYEQILPVIMWSANSLSLDAILYVEWWQIVIVRASHSAHLQRNFVIAERSAHKSWVRLHGPRVPVHTNKSPIVATKYWAVSVFRSTDNPVQLPLLIRVSVVLYVSSEFFAFSHRKLNYLCTTQHSVFMEWKKRNYTWLNCYWVDTFWVKITEDNKLLY